MKHAPAFPLEMVYTQENEKLNGMTLRDYLAAKAMQNQIGDLDIRFKESRQVIAERSYLMADAMLKAREV